MENDKVTFKIEEVEKEDVNNANKECSYSVVPVEENDGKSEAEDKSSDEALSVVHTEEPKTQKSEHPEVPGYNPNASKIEATGKVRDFKKEILLAVLALALCPVGIVLALKLEGYKTVGFVIALMGALTGIALFRHILLCRKVNALLATGKYNTVSALMAELKIKKKYDFVRTLGGMVREGHLTGYEITGDELITKVDVAPEEPKESPFSGLFNKKK